MVVGAGVAGLRCSKLLSARGLSVALLEASDAPGGRVRTDATDDGFLLDRGFQIFLTSYPEAKAALDYDALRLRPFYAGADVRTPVDGRYHRLADPFRHPVDALRSLLPGHGVGTLLDKVRVGLLRLASLTGGPYAYVRAPERTIDEALASWGFTPAFVDSFFRPFLGGIFFDAGLSTTDRLLTFVMRCLATGQNCLPERGIGAVSEQLAAGLPPGCLRLRSRVERIAPRGGNGLITVTLEPRGSSGGHESGEEGGASWGGGGVISARAVVLAVEGPEAVRLSNGRLESHGGATSGAAVGTTCVYFAAPAMRNTEPMLLLNGDGRRGPTAGLVNNACVPSVCPLHSSVSITFFFMFAIFFIPLSNRRHARRCRPATRRQGRPSCPPPSWACPPVFWPRTAPTGVPRSQTRCERNCPPGSRRRTPAPGATCAATPSRSRSRGSRRPQIWKRACAWGMGCTCAGTTGRRPRWTARCGPAGGPRRRSSRTWGGRGGDKRRWNKKENRLLERVCYHAVGTSIHTQKFIFSVLLSVFTFAC